MKRRLLLELGALALLGACSNVSRRPSTATSGAPAPAAAVNDQTYPDNPVKRQDIVIQAIAMLDRGYTYGGKKLHTGFDCSGLVSFVYQVAANITLKGSAAQMAQATRALDASQALPGDLVFFNTLGPAFSHVGIYLGDGKFVHAANEKTGVKTERLSHVYWAKRFQGFRTVFA